jgi:predicted dehydrogenase
MIKNSDKPIRVAVIGAGVRGTSLARKLSSSGLSAEVAAVAEPDEEKRRSFADEFNLGKDAVFTGWEDLTSMQDLQWPALTVTGIYCLRNLLLIAFRIV